MFKFSDILPFSGEPFFWFFGLAVLLVYTVKWKFSEVIPYRLLLASLSTAYLILLFPKPFQLLGLLLYLYGAYWYFRYKWKKEGLLLPIIVFSLPLLIMKSVNMTETVEYAWLDISKLIFQIAGLSYITFKVISLYIDEKDKEGKVGFLDFYNFTSFTPTLLIGPIDRYSRFQKDIQSGYAMLNVENREKGYTFLLKGLLYKFILAECINRFILLHLVDDGSMFYHFSYMYSYLLYLFFDFAGYSLLAMSFGHFIGIQVPFNFDKPFLSENPKMFWQRWHKTLGDWLNDYFFKPIFKDFTVRQLWKPVQRQNLALFLTFTLMGFWNGFEWHYIVSGALFGLVSMVHNYYSYRCKKNKRDVLFGKLPVFWVRWISIFMMFQCVAFAIYVFSGKLF